MEFNIDIGWSFQDIADYYFQKTSNKLTEDQWDYLCARYFKGVEAQVKQMVYDSFNILFEGIVDELMTSESESESESERQTEKDVWPKFSEADWSNNDMDMSD